MKFSLALLASSLIHVHFVSTKALLAVFGSSVTQGKSYPVEWLSDSEDYLELLLVRNNNQGWDAIQTLFQNRISNVPGDSYTWDVGTNLTAGSGYGLWLSSRPTTPNATTGYADLTEWFDIKFANGSLPVTASSTSLAATTSATGSTIRVNPSTTAGVTAAETATAQPAYTGATGVQRDQTLSKGAIIGIAVGVSVGVTIILVAIVTIMIYRRRRKAHAMARADSKHFSPDLDITENARPSFMTTATLVELPEDAKTERVEIPGQTMHPLEKDAEDVAPEKKTIPPEKPVELE